MKRQAKVCFAVLGARPRILETAAISGTRWLALSFLTLSACGLLITASRSVGQDEVVGTSRVGLRSLRSASRAVPHHISDASSSYVFSYIDFFRSPDTAAIGVNSGAISSKIETVGAYGSTVPLFEGGSGFLLTLGGVQDDIIETYRTVNFPGEPEEQIAGAINDSGQIAGNYSDSVGKLHGYVRTGASFATIDVPFSGAISTAAYGINNSGEIVGIWNDTSGTGHGFTLIGGAYTSLDFPGAVLTQPIHVNDNGDIVGSYALADQVLHGFLLSGGTYTTIDPPGSLYTQGAGINDAGDIVGYYCTTSQCIADQNSAQGFVLSVGVYTTINVPNSSSTILWDINNKKVLVGSYSNCDGGAGLAHAFIAYPGQH